MKLLPTLILLLGLAIPASSHKFCCRYHHPNSAGITVSPLATAAKQWWVSSEVRKDPTRVRPPNILPIFKPDRPVSYQLHEDWIIQTPLGSFLIPAGFILDGASVPRPLWGIWPPDGRHRAAAVLHDWLYANSGDLAELDRPLERWECDRLFLWACRKFRVGGAWLMWAGLKIGGSKAWASHTGKKPVIEPLHYDFSSNMHHEHDQPSSVHRGWWTYTDINHKQNPYAKTLHLDLWSSGLREDHAW